MYRHNLLELSARVRSAVVKMSSNSEASCGNKTVLENVGPTGEDGQSSEERTKSLERPVPPDGGYGWVVVAACFMCNLIVDGTCWSFGILVHPLIIAFDARFVSFYLIMKNCSN